MPRKAVLLVLFPFIAGCDLFGGGEEEFRIDVPGSDLCETPASSSTFGSTGSAYAFLPDPASASGEATLSPQASSLDSHKSSVMLSNLGGRGVLEGTYMDVRDGLNCNRGFGAFSSTHEFSYHYGDRRFQEAMTYYHGDTVRSFFAANQAHSPDRPIKTVVHCDLMDNAYYFRSVDQGTGLPMAEEVCLGDSISMPGGTFSDDAQVVIHELQHANTVNTYDTKINLNRFRYDEAGALNEALSDVVALIMTDDQGHVSLDTRVFSRWGLGNFFGTDQSRGAHRCPAYSYDFPECDYYQSGPGGFSAALNQVSFSYPDGVGWPYADNYLGPGILREIFLTFSSQEAIHVAGVPVVSALWDVYQNLLNTLDRQTARGKMVRLLRAAIENLPKPDAQDLLSPVTFRGFAEKLVQWSQPVGWSSTEKAELESILTDRGLYEGPLLASGWAEIGPGRAATPGIHVVDHPNDFFKLGIQGLPQNTGNGRLSAGEAALIWFDIQNSSSLTAGGISLKVTIDHPEVVFYADVNRGYVSPTEAQVMISKINGTGVVGQLSASSSDFHVPTGNSYFQTNLYYSSRLTTGLLVYVDSTVASGDVIPFDVEVIPSNGTSETLRFEATID